MSKTWERINVREHPIYGSIATFHGDFISSCVENDKVWENHICDTLAEYYVDGTDFIDMGANMGLNTVLFNKKKTITGTAHLFEPQHDVFTVMEYNTRSLSNRKLYNVCLSDGSGILGFNQTSFNIGATLMNDVGTNTTSPYNVHVSTINIDSLDFSKNRVSLCKIDVEGCEDRVLRGAKSFLETHKPTLVIEIWNHALHRVTPVLEELNYVQLKHLGQDDYVYIPKT